MDTTNRFLYISPQKNISASSTNGVTKEDCHFLYADRENNLWIATHTGLVKISNLPALSYTFDEKAAGSGDITGKDSILYITNSHYLYTLNENQLKKIHGFPDKKKQELVGRVLWDGSHLWASNWNGGIWKLKISDNKIISKSFFDGFANTKIKVHALNTDKNGNFWISGENGIFYIQNGKFIHHFQPPDKNGKRTLIITLALDTLNNILWAGDNEFGIYKYRYQIKADTISYVMERLISAADGLTDGHIRSLLLDSKGTLWAGTRFGGIFRIREQDGKFKVENLTKKANLTCARVTDIKEDGEQSIWIATCNGVYRYQFNTDRWQTYNTATGLLDSEVFTNFVSSKNQTSYSVSSSGVTASKFSETNAIPPPLVNITQIRVLGKNDSTAVYKHATTSYSAGESSIGFQFAGASYIDEKKIWYKYMLEGYDNTWSLPTQSNNVNYVSLPPGNYTFKVLASTDDDEWSIEPASFTFTIVRPFYKSPLFFLLLISLAFTGFYFFRMYQLKQRLQVERVRTRISSDLHDDIGSTLSSISIISEGAIDEQNSAARKEMIREINQNTMYLMDKMDDIIWCVNPQNDSFEHLMLRIKKFASGLFEAKGIDYVIE
ncbi:MAG: ligand-binding sensor domain-containing protein, partial [Flavisolibacter sp.]